MRPHALTILSLASAALECTAAAAARTNDDDAHLHRKRLTEIDGFYNSTQGGGSWLTGVIGTYPAGLGEPINAVLSSNSDAAVLTYTGFLDLAESWGFSGSCLGQSAGNAQSANLGDGNGYKNQTDLLRWNYGDPSLGTCTETIKGGNHFRYWVQNGTEANSGAIFMAVSYEKNLTYQHDIIADGYDIGRDELIGNATVTAGTTSSLTGTRYTTTVQLVSGFLPANTSDGINHAIEIDGLVAVFTSKVASQGSSSAAAASATGTSTSSATPSFAHSTFVSALSLSAVAIVFSTLL
ncbi:hypothetical protein T439DRAFT_318350 [Meredithblackwellia eburnea MCA 4105]